MQSQTWSAPTAEAGAPATDAAMMQAFLDGDRAAFAQLVRIHQGPVIAVVRRYAASAADAEDLAQRAFLRALEATGRSLRFRRGVEVPFRPYVIRIALNLAKSALRDAKRRARADGLRANAGFEPTMNADAQIERAQLARRARLAVLQLPRRQREVLTLRIDAELSFAEIGAVLRISENAAKVNFHHALVRLRAVTKEEGKR